MILQSKCGEGTTMSIRWPGRLRRMVASLAIVMIVSGCGGYVEIPRGQFEVASHDEDAIHRVLKQGGEEYLVNQFTLTDSTLVIVSLAPNDRRYHHIPLPIELKLDDINSIHRVDNGPPAWTIIALGAVGVGLFVAAVAWLSGGDAFTD